MTKPSVEKVDYRGATASRNILNSTINGFIFNNISRKKLIFSKLNRILQFIKAKRQRKKKKKL